MAGAMKLRELKPPRVRRVYSPVIDPWSESATLVGSRLKLPGYNPIFVAERDWGAMPVGGGRLL